MTPIRNLDELDDIHMDVLREIGNIGSGNAATALSQLLTASVDISVPIVKALDYIDIIEYIGDAEEVVAGLLFKFTGDIEGMIMYIFKAPFAERAINVFYEKKFDSLIELNDMDKSALCEIGNIMAGSYVNALASMTGMTIDISVPALAVDMVGAILGACTLEYNTIGDKSLLIDDNFNIFGDSFKSNMLLIPEMQSLSTLFAKLGIAL